MLAGIAILANCEAPSRANTNGSGSARAREIVITTVPLLTKELATTYPFLKKDFATGGVLAGKEVYEFMPSTITVAESDTLRLTFIILKTTRTRSSWMVCRSRSLPSRRPTRHTLRCTPVFMASCARYQRICR